MDHAMRNCYFDILNQNVTQIMIFVIMTDENQNL